MHLTFRNVNEAFRRMVGYFEDPSSGPSDLNIARSTSRVGDVLYIQEPCTITYTHPCERVLFNQARDCNPFFHLYESLWMLAGRNDIAPLNYYSSNYGKQVQDGDFPLANGAYGHRWRHTFNNEWGRDTDQLKLIVDHLKAKPDSRRCVLQMWNVEDDLLKIDISKDVCCNTCAYFSLRQIRNQPMQESDPVSNWGKHTHALDMTVCNRSNDLIWGTLGANAVHFSFLQEYLAAYIGCEVGVYNQFSNNQHVYVDRFEPEKWLADKTRDRYEPTGIYLQDLNLVLLVKDPTTFDREVAEFVEQHSRLGGFNSGGIYGDHRDWSEPFLADVAEPMCIAFHWHKKRRYDLALEMVGRCKADDWRTASINWLLKRKASYEARTNES